jgi:hypothetical protein
MSDGKWVPLDVRILHGDTKCEDVAVLFPDQKEDPLLKADPLPQTDNFFIGQEAYSLGFPYDLAMQASQMHLTAALLKHAYSSAVVHAMIAFQFSVIWPTAIRDLCFSCGDRDAFSDSLPGNTAAPSSVQRSSSCSTWIEYGGIVWCSAWPATGTVLSTGTMFVG